MNDELTPQEEEQQPGPSKTRFRDTARDLGGIGINAARDSARDPLNVGRHYDAANKAARQKLGEAMPRATETLHNTRGRDRGFDPSDLQEDHRGRAEGLDPSSFSNVFDRDSAKGLGKDLGKATSEIPKRSMDATKKNFGRVGTLAKNKKWFIAGGTGLGLLIPIAVFIFWLMMFKSVHIKNMYVTYRWAQFNRGLNKTLKEQLDYMEANPEAKAKGTADDVVSPDDSIDELSSKTNSELGPDNPELKKPEGRQQAADELTRLEQSIDGGSEKALTDANIDRNVKPAETEAKAKATLEEDIGSKELSKDPPDAFKEGADETKKGIEEGKPAAEAVDNGAKKVLSGEGWRGAFSKVSTVVFVTTMYCIFRDLYVGARDQLTKLAVTGAMGVAQEKNKIGSCTQIGKCDANVNAALSERYDNGKESFMDSCGAARAQQQSNPGCKEMDPKFVVNGLAKEIGGAGGFALNNADDLLDPPWASIGPVGMDDVCSLVMSPKFQVVVTLAEGAAIVTSGGGWAALGKGVTAGAATFAGTAGGKALIASYLAKVSGAVYRNLTPIDLGNLSDAGDAMTASATQQENWGPKVDSQTYVAMTTEYRNERIAANKKRSIFKKFFDTNSTDSVITRVALNSPTTPQAITGRIQNIFATISNPTIFSKFLGKNSLALSGTQSAYAGTDDVAAYGLSGSMNINPFLLPGAYNYDQVVKWGKTADIATVQKKFESCKSQSYAESIEKPDKKCVWGTSEMGEEGKLLFQYKNAQTTAYHNALRGNKQTTATASAKTAGTDGGSATADNPERNKDTSNPDDYPCPAGTTRSVANAKAGPSDAAAIFKVGLCDIGGMTVNASAAQAFLDMKKAAAADGVTLTGGGYRSYESQVSLRIAHGCGGANLFNRGCKGKPPTARPGRSMHEVGLAVDFDNCSYRSGPVYNWLAANAKRFGIYNLPDEAWHWSTTGS